MNKNIPITLLTKRFKIANEMHDKIVSCTHYTLVSFNNKYLKYYAALSAII